MNNILEIVGVIAVSLGGGGVIVFALSNWLGKIWAGRLMNDNKAKYDREIEQLKSSLNSNVLTNDFLFQKKYEALKEIRDGMAKISHVYMEGSLNNFNDDPDAYLKDLDEKLAQHSLLSGKWAIVLSREFYDISNFHYWIMEGLLYKAPTETLKYRAFIEYISRSYNDACRIELGVITREQAKMFEFAEIGFDEAQELGADGFLDLNFDTWLQAKY